MAKSSGFSNKTKKSFQVAVEDINAAIKEVKNVLPMGLRMIGEEIMTDVKDSRPGHGVPVDEGVLRSSGVVKGPEVGQKPQVELSFGGAAAPYALIQHEVLWFKHKVGEARYLVRGLERWKKETSAAFAVLQRLSKEALGKKT